MEEGHDAGNLSDEVPSNIQSLVEHIGFLPQLENESAEDLYNRVREGKCMTCEGLLMEDTILIINKKGIVAGYCGGACMQDMAVMGWIEEQHDDILDGINFRGGRGDTPE